VNCQNCQTPWKNAKESFSLLMRQGWTVPPGAAASLGTKRSEYKGSVGQPPPRTDPTAGPAKPLDRGSEPGRDQRSSKSPGSSPINEKARSGASDGTGGCADDRTRWPFPEKQACGEFPRSESERRQWWGNVDSLIHRGAKARAGHPYRLLLLTGCETQGLT
jgi:hypothetical protein